MMAYADQDNPAAGSATLEARLPADRPARSTTWKVGALITVIFLAGLVCGAAGMRAYMKSKPLMNWNDLLGRVAKRMRYDLNLSEEQQAGIAEVVRAHQPELDQIRSRTVHEMRTELQQVIEDMSAVLTPKQAGQFRSEAQPSLDRYFPADDGATPAKPGAP
jgi:Spy/CpxP family protein refolding chaperone